MYIDVLQSGLLVEKDTIAFGLYRSVRAHVQLSSNAVLVQRFEDSIIHFNAAIKQANEQVMAVLFAQRARSFEKLQQYDMMLADGKRVVECFPTSAQGYIQAARALQHKQKLRDALFTYDARVNAVSPDESLYQTLVSSKENLAAEINYRNLSLLGRLPYDIIDQIFSKISVIERTVCTLTCRGWRDMLLTWENMWTTVELPWIKSSRVLDWIARIDAKRVRKLSFDYIGGEKVSKLLRTLSQNGYIQLRELGKSPARV